MAEPDSCLNDFSKAIHFDSNNYKYYIYRGELYKNMNKNELAIKDYTNAIKANPISLTYLKRDELYYKLEKFKQAKKDFDQAKKLDPEYFKKFYHH
ncbi:hypothetical protein [Flectobacillus major]|uniref:hypothetical protein n=1 Tax=Flectobacillus major TaxID=103 RepID=UPI000693F2CA|nr:hypothetical protein [Flectobacillus major]